MASLAQAVVQNIDLNAAIPGTLAVDPDSNGDGNIDVVDVVNMVNYILYDTEGFDVQIGDINADGNVDIVDVVLVINIILE